MTGASRVPAPLAAWIAAVLLIVTTVAVFWPATRGGFIDLDDQHYVVENPFVRAGPEPESIAWAFRTFHVGNWHPLTWLSHMVDAALFGLDPRGHHAVNVGLHGLNVALLFAGLLALGIQPGAALFTAAAFGLHPLRVESVAWVSERKDVLSAAFGLLALIAYARYVRRPTHARMAAVAAALGAALMAKPMLVTLPFVFLLLDHWPLQREEPLLARVREKWPLFALVTGSIAVTVLAQALGEFVAPLSHYPLPVRIANAIVAYTRYLALTVWPAGLSVFYPHPGSHPAALVAGGGVVLVAISAGAWALRRRAPELLVGWLWYLGMLVPVIGVVQVGSQSMADRYTYLTLVGPVLAVTCAVARAAHRVARPVLVCACIALLGAGAAATREQLAHWRSSEDLFRHALTVGGPSPLVHLALANSLVEAGEVEEAIGLYQRGLAERPDDLEARNGLGAALSRLGRPDEALAQYRGVLRANPGLVHVRVNLGLALEATGDVGAAIEAWKEALRRDGDRLDARVHIGIALARLGRTEAARTELALALDRPEHLTARDTLRAHNALGVLLAQSGRLDEARNEFSRALALAPDNAELHRNMGNALAALDRLSDAVKHYESALRIAPDDHHSRTQLDRVHDQIRQRSLRDAPLGTTQKERGLAER